MNLKPTSDCRRLAANKRSYQQICLPNLMPVLKYTRAGSAKICALYLSLCAFAGATHVSLFQNVLTSAGVYPAS